MTKTIRGKMALAQGLLILLILGSISVVFIFFAENYYFEKKLDIIKAAFRSLNDRDIEKIRPDDKDIIAFEEQKLRFVITDEKFRAIYVSPGNMDRDVAFDNGAAELKIERTIINKLNKYKENQIETKNGRRRIGARGIIVQNGHKYYVFIYELKMGVKIIFSYYKIFFVIVAFIASAIGVIISMIISNKISKPIKQMQLDTGLIVKNNYNVLIDENQKFEELSGLANSINTMISKIKSQIQMLETEIRKKEQTENMRKQFVNNVSHELKTPLAIMSSQVEILQYLDNEDKKKEYCNSIIEEIGKMSEMISDMIAIFSMQSDEETLSITDVEISDLIRNLCKDYYKLFDEKNIVLCEEYDLNTNALVNVKLFKQAVSNYISNAIKHSAENTKITVRVLSSDEKVRVEVENQGEHICEELKDKIWNMFYSGDDGTLNGQKNSGLGLYLVKSIAELHNADYGCENTQDGVIFYIETDKVQKSH